MKKILLLVFVHGYCGDDDTFGAFPPYIQGLISNSLPRLTVVTKVYPKYETRGDLAVAVNKLQSWLQDIVMNLEASNNNKYPRNDPTVGTIFVCHSMGGIVAAETLLGIVREQSKNESGKGCMWPYIQGILAFDSPYLGLAPQMFAHSADGGIRTATEALGQVRSLASLWAGGGNESSTTEKDAMTAGRLMIEDKEEKKSHEKRDKRDKRDKDKDKDKEREKERKSSRSDSRSRSTRTENKSDRSERRESKSEKSERRESKSERSERRESRSDRDRRESRGGRHEERTKSVRPKNDRKSSSSFSSKDAAAAAATATASAPDIPLPKPPTSPPLSPTASESPAQDTGSLWSRWSKVALYAGAAATLAAAGATAYMKRSEITTGFSWVTSHVEFVGVLMKGEQLRQRLESTTSIRGVGFANLYTSMGPNSFQKPGAPAPRAMPTTQQFLTQERTFCSEPSKESPFRKYFRKQINEKAKDEIEMHTGMFSAETNSNYYGMCAEARDLVVKWVTNGWGS